MVHLSVTLPEFVPAVNFDSQLFILMHPHKHARSHTYINTSV